jgi:hypothetical protein
MVGVLAIPLSLLLPAEDSKFGSAFGDTLKDDAVFEQFFTTIVRRRGACSSVG